MEIGFEVKSFKKYKNLIHGFTTRHGGCSQEPYDDFNLALHVEDRIEDVIKNRETLCSSLGIEVTDMVTAQQVHSPNVAVVGEEHKGAGVYAYHEAMPETDGLITDKRGILLATFYADCVPVFIFDPVKQVIGSIHSGWKGTMDRIGAAAIQKMRSVYGSDPADCLVGIGPSIGPCCYEVDGPVIDIVKNKFKNNWSELVAPKAGDKAQLNIWKANYIVMREAGVPHDNIEMAETCTCCTSQQFFSYRGSGGTTGRMAAYIMLKNEDQA